MSFKALGLLFLVGLFFLAVGIPATEEARGNMETKMSAIGQNWYAKANQKNRCYFDVHHGYTVKICG